MSVPKWIICFRNARSRCVDFKNLRFPRYGGRGIKFLLSCQDMENLWNRDKAWLLKKPSIDRINNDGNYEFDNCRFIELSENSRKNMIDNHPFKKNEARKKMSLSTKKRWGNKNNRNELSKKLLESSKMNLEINIKKSLSAKNSWTEERKEKQSKIIKETWKTRKHERR
jgi:hypothetical protein